MHLTEHENISAHIKCKRIIVIDHSLYAKFRNEPAAFFSMKTILKLAAAMRWTASIASRAIALIG
jgi:hypothetical protein